MFRELYESATPAEQIAFRNIFMDPIVQMLVLRFIQRFKDQYAAERPDQPADELQRKLINLRFHIDFWTDLKLFIEELANRMEHDRSPTLTLEDVTNA